MGIPRLPVSMLAAVSGSSTTVTRYYNNPGGDYDGYPYEFEVTLNVTTLSTSEPPNYQFSANDITVGMWLLQNTGFCYQIVDVQTPISTTEIVVTLKDVDLSEIIEMDDDTDLRGEAACAGGACEITLV